MTKRGLRIPISLSFVTLLALAGCDQWVEEFDDPNLYDDPNRATEVGIDQQFIAMQVRGFHLFTGHLARTAAVWMQSMSGTDRQFSALGRYEITENDHDTEWTMAYTDGGLIDIRQVIAKAEESERLHYAGMAKVWEALIMGLTTSIWGDIPYSEAVSDVAQPQLDAQADVYAALQSLLDEAIANLSLTNGGVGPGAVDLVFGGDVDKWIETAHSLQARLHLHWAEGDPARYGMALTHAKLGISSLDGTFMTAQGSGAGEDNMWNQFFRERDSYMRGGDHMISLLKSRNDPRLSIYYENATDADSIRGSSPGDADISASYLNLSTVVAPSKPVDILSYEETLLIIAEAEYQAGNEANALAALNSVREAANDKWDLTGADEFMDLTGLTGAALLEAILEEKYISLLMNIEVWNDYKRTCYPALATFNSEEIPGRLIYGIDERNANSNIPVPADQPSRNDNDPAACP